MDNGSRDVIRKLAGEVAERANSEENAHRQRLWSEVHSLRKPERPPVICHPGCWEELIPRSQLVSQEPHEAEVEYQLRRMLYKWEIGDDTVLEPWWPVHASVELQGEHFWGLPVGYTHSGVPGGAWGYVYPVKEEADLDHLVMPQYRHNTEQTEENLSRMDELLGDLLPVRRVCHVPGPGAWLHGWATQLCGVEQLLLHIMDRPQWVHRLMATLRDGFLGVMTQFEEMGLLTLNNTGLMSCDDLPLPDFDSDHVRLCDLWGRGESQEFQAVSPAQHEEFLLRYQLPILKRFGLIYYGCCEDLTHKIALILSIPNLRKFVSSPWTDLEKLAAAVGDRYAIEWRQRATDVVFASDMKPIRDHLERGLQTAKGCCLHIVLQELETVNGNPERLKDWAAVAKEVGAKYS